ncbi:MAG: hypothetical protein GEV07_24015 [Streptosporangiales bacterium]|nr:hypothetical protein [Streptosporangiales bacterium]
MTDSSADNPYLDHDNGVLRNRYGITNRHMLELQVRLDASAAELELRRHDTPIRFNARPAGPAPRAVQAQLRLGWRPA